MRALPDIRLPLRIRSVSDEGLSLEDASGIALAYFHFDPEPGVRRAARNRQSKEQAIAVAQVTARAIEAAVRGATPVTSGDTGDNPLR